MSKHNVNSTSKAPEHHRVRPVEHHASIERGNTFCIDCGAVYSQKKWSVSARQLEEMKEKNEEGALCPGCEMIKTNSYEGELILLNQAANLSKDEMTSIVRNTEKQCWRKNPNSRVVNIAEEADGIHIFTTTRLLAERIGKALQSAHKGSLEVEHTDDLSRLIWTK